MVGINALEDMHLKKNLATVDLYFMKSKLRMSIEVVLYIDV